MRVYQACFLSRLPFLSTISFPPFVVVVSALRSIFCTLSLPHRVIYKWPSPSNDVFFDRDLFSIRLTHPPPRVVVSYVLDVSSQHHLREFSNLLPLLIYFLECSPLGTFSVGHLTILHLCLPLPDIASDIPLFAPFHPLSTPMVVLVF